LSNTIDISCKQCKRINSRKYSWIDPSKFSKPEKAFMLSSFHCKFCSLGNAIKIQFLSDGKISLSEIIDFKTLINEENSFAPEEEIPVVILTEDAAISLLNDNKD
jgi:hypothetical protein